MRVLNRAEIIELIRANASSFDHLSESNPFASIAWYINFIEHGTDPALLYLAPVQDGENKSLMLLCAEGNNPTRLKALRNYYASLYSPLISAASDGRAATDSLVRQCRDHRPRVATIEWTAMDPTSPDFQHLAKSLATPGWLVKQFFCFGNWYLPCEGMSFEAYMQARPRQIQNTYTRKSRKFVSDPSAKLEIVTAPEDVGRAMQAYQSVYMKSWKQPEPYPDFVPGWASTCARHGWLRLGIAWVNGVPIAAQFWFTMNRRAYIFKLAYDEDYAKLSAGTILTAHMMQHALDVDKVTEIDYLSGDDDYKRNWMTHRRERHGLLACNLFTPIGLAVGVREIAASAWHRLRNWISPKPGTDIGPQMPLPVASSKSAESN